MKWGTSEDVKTSLSESRYGAVWVKTNQSHRKSTIILKIMQHERKVHIKQESALYKKWEGNQFLEQETLTVPWDMSTIQVELYVRVISNT